MSSSLKRICPKCGKRKLVRLIGTGSPQIMTGNVRYSWAMAVDPSQIDEAEKKYPGSKYRRDDGRLIVNGRIDKVKKMKERNLVELTRPDLERQRKSI